MRKFDDPQVWLRSAIAQAESNLVVAAEEEEVLNRHICAEAHLAIATYQLERLALTPLTPHLEMSEDIRRERRALVQSVKHQLVCATESGLASENKEYRRLLQAYENAGDVNANFRTYIDKSHRPTDRATASLKLGDFYRDGLGVPKNSERARAWYAVAEALGSEEATNRLHSDSPIAA